MTNLTSAGQQVSKPYACAVWHLGGMPSRTPSKAERQGGGGSESEGQEREREHEQHSNIRTSFVSGCVIT